MKFKSLVLSGVLFLGLGVLAGCGGGGDDAYDVDEDDSFTLSVSAQVNAQPVEGSVPAGESETLVVSVGESFELTSTVPVDWTVIVAGQPIEGAGATILYGGAVIQETFRSGRRWAAQTSTGSYLVAPVNLTLLARSRADFYQVVAIDVRITP